MDALCIYAIRRFGGHPYSMLVMDPNGHRFVPVGPMPGIDG